MVIALFPSCFSLTKTGPKMHNVESGSQPGEEDFRGEELLVHIVRAASGHTFPDALRAQAPQVAIPGTFQPVDTAHFKHDGSSL